MRLCRALLIASSLAPFAAGAALAQGAPDPFGAPPKQTANDPFGAPPAQTHTRDPFGPAPAAAPARDPFGAPGAPQPQVGYGTFAPPPQRQVQQQPQQPPPCVAEFFKLRDAAQKKAEAIQKASERHATPKEACHLFTLFSAAEAKMLKYAVDNKSSCGVPDQIVTQIKSGHSRTNELKAKICKVAAAPPRPAGPSLSDALGAPIPSVNNVRSGHGGTFDTLTGNPLGK
jgi:hypothetical protein